jgi:alkylation response protein AidB-like acyl-CoA dehydrogenase
MQLGNLEKALSMTTAYTCEREQFGVPIGSFQAVSHRVADAYMLIVNLRNTTHDACCELISGGDSSLPVLVAKYWCGEAGHAGMATFQHVHGGMGADRDYGLWRHTVWSKQFEMQLGSSSEMVWRLGEALAGPA